MKITHIINSHPYFVSIWQIFHHQKLDVIPYLYLYVVSIANDKNYN